MEKMTVNGKTYNLVCNLGTTSELYRSTFDGGNGDIIADTYAIMAGSGNQTDYLRLFWVLAKTASPSEVSNYESFLNELGVFDLTNAELFTPIIDELTRVFFPQARKSE